MKTHTAMKSIDDVCDALKQLNEVAERTPSLKELTRKDIADMFETATTNNVAAAITFYIDKKGIIINSHLHLKDDAHKILQSLRK